MAMAVVSHLDDGTDPGRPAMSRPFHVPTPSWMTFDALTRPWSRGFRRQPPYPREPAAIPLEEPGNGGLVARGGPRQGWGPVLGGGDMSCILSSILRISINGDRTSEIFFIGSRRPRASSYLGQ